MDVHVDAGAGMASIGEVAVWSFDLIAWGECAQAATEAEALRRFARRVGRDDLDVVERITGPAQVFEPDLRPAHEEEVVETIRLLERHRAISIDLLLRAPDAALDAEEPGIAQPGWMPWRTPRAILRHLAEDASGGYLARVGLPVREPSDDLLDDLRGSLAHTIAVLGAMPRDLVVEYRGEVWTSVKLLRREAWHERVEQVFLRRRLRAAGMAV